MGGKWNLESAFNLCREIEAIAPEYGCHVALTGGCLYKFGMRKDVDILFYRIRQVESIDVDGLFAALSGIGITKVSGFGWCIKAKMGDAGIDCFFPEADGKEYPQSTANPDFEQGC